VAPGAVPASYTLRLPTGIPGTAAENLAKVDGSGNMSFSDTITLNNLGVRDVLSVQNSFTGFETRVRAGTGLASDLDLTLPASYGSGGFVKSTPSGELSVEQNVSAPVVSTPELVQSSNSPGRTFITGVASLNVASNGTYTLLDIPADGSPASVSFTVFAHDEDAAVGSGTLTQTFNAHYNGSTAVLSAGSDKVDSWSATTEPAFSADYSGTNFRVRVTTASGSNELNFMLRYTYVINVDPV